MATAGDIINRALRATGILASGETADANMAQDALVQLNYLLESLSNENLMIYQDTTDSLTLDGSASYTWGTSGTPDIATARPVTVHSAYWRSSDSLDYPVPVISVGEWDRIADKSLTSDIPTRVYVNMTYPNATVYVYPVSDTGTLYISSNKQLTAFASLFTDVSLPPGYERMLVYGLAAELMIEYGIINQAIEQRYFDAKNDLKRTNAAQSVLVVSLPFGRTARRRNIETDGA